MGTGEKLEDPSQTSEGHSTVDKKNKLPPGAAWNTGSFPQTLLLPTEVSSFRLHRNSGGGGGHSTSIKQMSWLPGHSVTLFLGKLEQAKRTAPLFRAAFLHYTVFTRNPQQIKRAGREPH